MIEDISNRLLGDFAKCLQTSLAGGGEAGDGQPAAPRARDLLRGDGCRCGSGC